MTKSILVAGTASHVGKSTVVAGLCRLLADRGRSVAPFKAQNMSNNARVALTPSGTWGEIGVSQYAQAIAARVAPTTDMNPVLLKPRGNGESQLVIHGDAVAHLTAAKYHDREWERARAAAVESYQRLAANYEVIIAEGAGSPAEINLQDRDLANIETARFADADVLLLVDIERGGAFASLYGTLELVPPNLRDRVRGVVITKFRGDRSVLDPGIDEIEARTGVPIIGVLPFKDPGLPAEDSVFLPVENDSVVLGADDGVSPDESITIAVVRLPRISNFTDFEPLVHVPGVRVAYVPLSGDFAGADAVIIPGTKNTVDDLHALRSTGLSDAITAFPGPIVGICGGYQMLGERLTNAAVEGTGDEDVVAGLGLLPVETRFSPDKHVAQATRTVEGEGLLAGAAGTVTGYEIHMGKTRKTEPISAPLGPNSAAVGNVLGTYLHGLFENRTVREAFIRSIYDAAERTPPTTTGADPSPYQAAARLVDTHVDLQKLGV